MVQDGMKFNTLITYFDSNLTSADIFLELVFSKTVVKGQQIPCKKMEIFHISK